MKAVKFWSSASQKELEASGFPPLQWIKETVDFENAADVPYFESNGYTVMTYDDFSAYVAQHQSAFQSYLENGYATVEQFNKLFEQNENKVRLGKEFLLRFKLKNLSEGITWPQAVWLHQRIKSWKVTVNGLGEFEVDLYNVVNSGDLESAIYIMQSGQADDMTEPYHFISRERINWCVQELTRLLSQNT